MPAPRDFHPSPLFICAVCLSGGILAAQFSVADPHLYPAVGLTSLTLALLCFLTSRLFWVTPFIAVSFAAAGGALLELDTAAPPPNSVQHLIQQNAITAGALVEITGTLERAPETAPDGAFLTLRVQQIEFNRDALDANGVVWLFIAARGKAASAEFENLRLRRGTRVRVMTTLERADRYRNPGVGTLTEFLERKNYDAIGAVKSSLLVETLGEAWAFPPLRWLDLWREVLLSRMRTLFSPPTAGVLAASLLGNRHFLTGDAAERFRDGGTFHVLVISGMHMTFIGGLMLAVARFLTKHRFWQFASALTVLWSYTLMVGAELSVVRAAVTFSFVALAPVLHRRADPLNAVGASALLLLVWRPKDLFDPSFQLTFLSVLAIVALGWPLIERLRSIGAWRPTRRTPCPPGGPRWLVRLSQLLYWDERLWRTEMKKNIFRYRLRKQVSPRLLSLLLRHTLAALVISASVQLTLLPLLVLYFHRVSVASLLLNVVVGALMALLSLVSLAALALALIFEYTAAPVVQLAEYLNWLMTHSVDPFLGWNLAATRLPEYTGKPAALYAFYYLPLVTLVVALNRWDALAPEKRTALQQTLFTTCAAVSLLLCVLLIVCHPWSERLHSNVLEISFLDVGQGDAALVVLPDRTVVLIDGGGRPRIAARGDDEESFEPDRRSIGETVVSEYLWRRGLSRVDYLIATHADADHMQGLVDVARNFRVRGALLARTPAGNGEYRRFAAALGHKGVPVVLVGAGDVLRAEGVEISVLWPRLLDNNAAASGNDSSLVLMLRHGQRRALLTGDVEAAVERQLLAQNEDLRCDIVKVAHHGSRTSSTARFVENARASLAVISVGHTSPYGHPAPEVVERWRKTGAQVLTTGQSGTVTVTTDGSDLRLQTFVPR